MSSTSASPTPRVEFREDQPLRAADLNAEQAYMIALRRIHNAAEHGWGIVHGLTLTPDGAGGVHIKPGLAVDGYGRELVVAAPVALTQETLAGLGSDAVDLWLVYLRGTEDSGGRWREDVFVRLVAADPNKQVTLAVPDRRFLVAIPPPDDSRVEWPVYLGRVGHLRPKQDDADKSPIVGGWGRTDAGLMGEQVQHPSGNAQVQIGAELAGDPRRFAVRFADEAGNWKDRLTIDDHGNTTITGHVFSEGEPAHAGSKPHPPRVTLRPLKGPHDPLDPSFGSLEFRPLPAPPKAAKPWQVYHAVLTDGTTAAHELRAEISNPGAQDDPANYRLTIWGWPYSIEPIQQRVKAAAATPDIQKPTFQPLLTVKASGDVEVTGDLTIREGQLLQGPIPADPKDPRFQTVLANQWAQGLSQGFNTLAPSGLKVGVSLDDPTPQANVIHYLITVQNTAAVALDPVQVSQHITYPGSPSDQPVPPKLGTFRLEAGQTLTLPRQTYAYTHSAGQNTIHVSILVLGVATTGSLMHDTVEQDFPAA